MNKKTLLYFLIVVIVIGVVLALWYTYSKPPYRQGGNGNGEQRNSVQILAEYNTKVVYTTDTSLNEDLYKQDCAKRGGTFDSCGSVCEPGAEICAEVCAYTCNLVTDSGGNKNKDGNGGEIISENFVPVSDWKTYNNNDIGFSIKYPPRFSLVTPDRNTIAFIYTGPTQEENTELFDGISMTIRRVDTTGFSSLQAYVENYILQNILPVGEIVQPVNTVQIAEKDALVFTASTLGISQNIFVPLETNSALHISYGAPDPENRGYEKIVQRMIDSFTLTE